MKFPYLLNTATTIIMLNHIIDTTHPIIVIIRITFLNNVVHPEALLFIHINSVQSLLYNSLKGEFLCITLSCLSTNTSQTLLNRHIANQELV